MKVYLSPSTQERNLGVDKVTEEARMGALAQRIAELLRAKGHEVEFNSPEMHVDDMVDRSNIFRPALHLALHSNAGTQDTPEKKGTAGKASGIEAWVHPGNPRTEKLGMRLTIVTHQILDLPIRRGMRHGFVKFTGIDGPHLAEVDRTNAPAVLLELFFHDNEVNVRAYEANEDRLAVALASVADDFLRGRET